MKKSPIQWIILLAAAACVIFAGVSLFRTMKAFNETQEKLDKSQIAIQSGRDTIDEIEKARAAAAKAERQKALDEQKAAQASGETKEPEEEETDKEEIDKEDTQMEEPEETEEPEEPTTNGKVIGIDPGHQGSWVDMSALEPNAPGSSEMKARCTTGTTGNYSGLEEFQLNLNVSLLLRDILLERGYEVVMTREDNDANISNAERAQKVAEAGADIYVRVHANSDASTSASGALTMSPSSSNPYVGHLYEESYRLSETILNSYCEKTGFGNRGVMLTDTMTGINWSTIPVTIVEMGFMSNQGDDTTMADGEFQKIMAEGIANGIDAYYGQ